MKKNNKGFSLVELIVTFAIVGIIGVAVYGFMAVSNRQFVSVSNDVGLQYDQQIVVNQIRDYILESSDAIYYDTTDSSLYVFKQTDEEVAAIPAGPGTPEVPGVQYKYRVSKLRFTDPNAGLSEGDEGFDSTKTGVLYVNTKLMDTFDPDASADDAYKNDLADTTKEKELGRNISSLVFDLSEIDDNKVSFDIVFYSEGKEFKSHQVVSLRNTIIDSDELGDIYDTSRVEITSSIESVKILRNGEDITDPYCDPSLRHVGKYGAGTVEVTLVPKVVANAASKYSYDTGVTWKLVSPSDPSIENPVAGVSITQGGVLSVSGTAPNDAVVRVVATSKADPSKLASVDITIDEMGSYPKQAILSVESTEDGNGYRKYYLKPQVRYTNAIDEVTNILEKDALLTGNMKIEWKVSGSILTETANGVTCGLDEKTGVFTVTSVDNGKIFNVYFDVKELGADGNTVSSNTIQLKPDDIPEYVSPESIKLSMPENSNRGDSTTATVSWVNTPDKRVKYYWKIVDDADNTTGSWYDVSTGAISTDFDKIVSVKEEDKTKDSYFKKLDASLGDKYGQFEDGLDGSGWYESSDGQRFANINIESYLYWKRAYKIKVLCFAVSEDDKVVYDMSGSHKVEDGKPIRPVSVSTIIPKVQFILEASDVYKGDGGYKTGIIMQQNKKLPGEQRAFNYRVLGLNVVQDSSDISGLLSDDKDIKTHYIFYNSAGKKVNVNKYTGKTSFVATGESRVDHEELAEAYSQFMFELDIKKTRDGKNSDFFTYNPQKMVFSITLNQDKKVDGTSVKNSVNSNEINYNLMYVDNK